MAPRVGIEYVIAHELTHLIHPHHSAEFYGVLDSVMPDWRKVEVVGWKSGWTNNNAVRQLFNVDNLSIYKLIFGITFRFFAVEHSANKTI